MTWALIGAKIMNFLKEVPIWVWILIVFAVTLKWTQMSSYKKGGDAKVKEQAVETAKERERVIATAQEEVDNVEAAKDAALAAPDSLPEFGSADELRDEAPAIAKVILGNRG